jgi:hypothetical protein
MKENKPMESRRHLYWRIVKHYRLELIFTLIIGLILGAVFHSFYIFRWVGINHYIYQFKPNAIIMQKDLPIQIIKDEQTLAKVKKSYLRNVSDASIGAGVVFFGGHKFALYSKEILSAPRFEYKVKKGLKSIAIHSGDYTIFQPTGILSQHPQLVEYIKTEDQAKAIRHSPNIANSDSAVVGAAITPSKNGLIIITRPRIQLHYKVKDYPLLSPNE